MLEVTLGDSSAKHKRALASVIKQNEIKINLELSCIEIYIYRHRFTDGDSYKSRGKSQTLTEL